MLSIFHSDLFPNLAFCAGGHHCDYSFGALSSGQVTETHLVIRYSQILSKGIDSLTALQCFGNGESVPACPFPLAKDAPYMSLKGVTLWVWPVSYLCPGHTLQWRHYERDGIWNNRRIDFLPNRLFKRKSKKTSKLRVTGLCERNPPGSGGFPSHRASNAENVSIWWRHHDILQRLTILVFLYRESFLISRQCRENCFKTKCEYELSNAKCSFQEIG